MEASQFYGVEPRRAGLVVFLAMVLLGLGSGFTLAAPEKTNAPETSGTGSGSDASVPEKGDKAVALQIFLDRANFGPGKIDGLGGEFTEKALTAYLQASGGDAGDKSGSSLPLDNVNPLYQTYTMTDEDLKNVGPSPKAPEEAAKLKSLPYSDTAELVAEKFHSAASFIKKLNHGKDITKLKAGDQVTVPNVQPLDLAEVEKRKAAAGQEEKKKHKSEEKQDEGVGNRSIRVDVAAKWLEVHDGDKVIAAFPITPGSQQLPAPKGEWFIKSIDFLPEFRYDKAMLMKGERSSDFHLLPPGPRNPVGLVWMQLNKKGIGIHGTNEPETIGRSASHGCIRLANWDVVKLSDLVKPGTHVVIQ